MIRQSSIASLLAAWVVLAQHSAGAFQISPLGSATRMNTSRRPATFGTKSNAIFSPLCSSGDDNDGEVRSVSTDGNVGDDIWGSSSMARKAIAGLSTIGMVETGYLSYLKLYTADGISKICGGGEAAASSLSSCTSVLNSPYATIQLGDINLPLTLVGCAAYAITALLAAVPLLSDEEDGSSYENNRIAILCTTTAMATFSSFLLSLLFNTLHQSCPFCLLSAALSISMGFTAWISGALPMSRRQDGVKVGLGSFFTTTLAALALFLSVDEVAMQAYKSELVMAGNGLSNNVVAQAKSDAEPKKDIPAPPITATSSARALKIGADLKTLDAKMYGAYWCSHCFEQKQRLGREAYYGNVQYVECSKEGLNSEAAFCKEQKVPGYPTWEIGGKQFPGDMYLDELEDIIKDVKSKQM